MIPEHRQQSAELFGLGQELLGHWVRGRESGQEPYGESREEMTVLGFRQEVSVFAVELGHFGSYVKVDTLENEKNPIMDILSSSQEI